MPTVVDDDALEAARLASLPSSKPPRGASSFPPLETHFLARTPVRVERKLPESVGYAAGFLLGFVDGEATLQAIAHRSGFAPADVLVAFADLQAQGVIAFTDGRRAR